MPAFSLTPINSFPQQDGTEFPNPLRFALDGTRFTGPITEVDFLNGTVTEDGDGTLSVSLDASPPLNFSLDDVPFSGPITLVNFIDGTVVESTGGKLDVTLNADFTLGRRVEYATFGGNGTAIGGFGGPHQNNLGMGAYSNVLGQTTGTPSSSDGYQQLSRTQFSSDITWGCAWGSNWSPFIKAMAPFTMSALIRGRDVDDPSVNTWFVGFAGNRSYPTGSPPEAAYTDAFGFRIPTTAIGENFLRIVRVNNVNTAVDTGVPKPSPTKAHRLSVLVGTSTITFMIDELNNDQTFTNLYAASIALSEVSNVAWSPVLGGPAAAGCGNDVYYIRGIYHM